MKGTESNRRTDDKPKPGEQVILTGVPLGLAEGLPIEEQRAIYAAVGKRALLNGYDDSGKAELEFRDKNGLVHHISVGEDAIKKAT
ncbi:MAG TPA: hypothetical protein VJN21_11805 [Candidatus Acidoferrales bacterium]|nr:hypothetical protein [Candidatus Acidoferrales bacterium]